MQSEGKFLHYFKVVAPRAVSTFGAKIGHLSFIMMLDSSSYEVRSVSQHLCHFVRPSEQCVQYRLQSVVTEGIFVWGIYVQGICIQGIFVQGIFVLPYCLSHINVFNLVSLCTG